MSDYESPSCRWLYQTDHPGARALPRSSGYGPASGVTVGGFAEGATVPPVAIAEGGITSASFASGAAVPLPSRRRPAMATQRSQSRSCPLHQSPRASS
jgi:hypothetical protein